MADELEKKPKPIGTPAPNYPKPKAEPAPQQLKLDRQKSASFGKVKVKPGSPAMHESVPVGVQQTKFESPKHVEKRVNKMFKETNQPTLGIWNKNNTNPMSDPDKVRFNPNLKYKPSKEALEAANRKKIMQAGFAPKNWDGKSDVETGIDFKIKPEVKENFDKVQQLKNIRSQEHSSSNVPGNFKNKTINGSSENDSAIADNIRAHTNSIRNKNSAEFSNNLIDLDNKFNKNEHQKLLDEDKIALERQKINKERDALKKPNNTDPFADNNNGNTLESDERSKASELFGTDLNKQQGYDYDRLAQELDSGEWTGLDADLIGSDYGYNNLNENQNLAADARKNPETGKYEVSIYPVSENGPLPGYEPEENEPTYEFDTFDDLKAFMENGYKKQETPQWDPANNPGSGAVSKGLLDYVKNQLKKDGGLNDNFIDAYVNNLYKNANQADYWKGKMKEDWEKKYGK